MQRPAVVSEIPKGVGGPPPPGMDPRKGKGKLMCIKVRMLDDAVAVFHLGHKANGQALFDEVCRHLNLLECDYFGLEFIDGYGNRCWLDKDKSILRQITSTQSDARFYFIVKFYTPNPADLEEEYTRYLLSLQIRRDLSHGEFICGNENTAALLVSFIVQAECGDFSSEDYPDHTYLSVTNFVPNQTAAFQMKVMENHKKLIGMSPADADLALLETARRCDFYGIKLHLAKDIEGTEVSLSVAHMGIKVFHQLACVSTFSWAKIRKLSFKRKRLMIKLHPDSYQYYKETIEFNFENRNDCKNFWKKCVEHHAFFRCFELFETKKEAKLLFSRGSSFKYHGRTQKQMIDYVREHRKRREPFQRPLRASTRRVDSSTTRRIQFNVASDLQKPSNNNYPGAVDDRYSSVIRNGPKEGSVSARNYPATSYSQKQYPNSISSTPYPAVYYPGASNHHQHPHHTTKKGRPQSAYIQGNHPSTSNDHHCAQQRMCASEIESLATTYGDHSRPILPSDHQARNGKRKVRGEPIPEMIPVHGQPDQMSTSLPNVLGSDDLRVLCKEYQLRSGADSSGPPKSSSGDNLLEQLEESELCDNTSEGSYKLAADFSSQSDVGPCSAATSARVYATNFTTKRVGNVIVKKVMETATHGGHSLNHQQPATSSQTNLVHHHQAQHQQRVPTTNYEPNDSNGDDECSSAYSDYCKSSSVSAPASANTRHSNYRWGAPASRFQNAVPIPIDGPMAIPEYCVPQSTRTTIIKPIVIQHPKQNAASTSYRVFQQSIRKPIVCGVKSTFDPGDSSEQEKSCSISEPVKSQSTANEPVVSQGYSPKPAVNPGRVIHKQNLVITPDGITVKEETVKQKPKVPPKPKNIAELNGRQQQSSQDDAAKAALLEPLNSILNNTQELSEVLGGGGGNKEFKPCNDQKPVISVASDDTPEIMKLHLFGNKIPYTLTMRNVETTIATESTQPENQVVRTVPNTPLNPLRPFSSRNSDSKKHRKSLDLVYRRRLPSQDSFSSQDHSISPTTPDNVGNVAEYVMRRRSLSSDRQVPTDTLKMTEINHTKTGRTSDRRHTQPVKLEASNLKMSVSAPKSEENGNQNTKDSEKAIAQIPAIDKSNSSETTDMSDSLPEPPKIDFEQNIILADSEKVNATNTPEAILAEKIISGILETDF